MGKGKEGVDVRGELQNDHARMRKVRVYILCATNAVKCQSAYTYEVIC